MKKIVAKIKQKEHQKVNINGEFIKLDSLLKMCNAVMTGGHAKIVIQEGEVWVNGEICIQRGRKLRSGDKAEFERVIYIVE